MSRIDDLFICPPNINLDLFRLLAIPISESGLVISCSLWSITVLSKLLFHMYSRMRGGTKSKVAPQRPISTRNQSPAAQNARSQISAAGLPKARQAAAASLASGSGLRSVATTKTQPKASQGIYILLFTQIQFIRQANLKRKFFII